MALKAKITADEFKALPEVLQKEYKPLGEDATKATEFLLDAEGVEDVTGLKNNSTKLLNEKALIEKQLKDYRALGDPEKVKKAVAQIAELEEKRLREEGDFKKIQEQTITKHAEEMAAKDKELAKVNGFLAENLIDAEAVKAIVAEKGKPKLLLRHVVSQMKVIVNEATGKPEAVVVDASGTPRIATGGGQRMTVIDLVKELKADPDFGGAFEPSGAAGGGATKGAPTTSAGGAKTVIATDQAALNANIKGLATGDVKVAEA